MNTVTYKNRRGRLFGQFFFFIKYLLPLIIFSFFIFFFNFKTVFPQADTKVQWKWMSFIPLGKSKKKKKRKNYNTFICIDPIATAVCHRSSNSIILFFNEFLINSFETFKKNGYIWYIFIYMDKKRKMSDIYILISSTVVLLHTVFNLRKGWVPLTLL